MHRESARTMTLMQRFVPVACGLLIVLTTPRAFADDIRLKSGEWLTEVEVVTKDDTSLRVRSLDGKMRTIPLADVDKHIEKPTSGQELDEKAKALKQAKNIPELITLAKWGFERGAVIHAKKLLNEVIKMDKENEEAHTLLEHEKLGGKWLSGKAIEEYKAREEIEKKKALGWVEVGGKWMDPFAAKATKAGFTLVPEYGWRTKDEVAKIEKGMLFVDGQWYEKADKEKLDQEMRLEGGKWMTIKEADEIHRKEKSPWVVESSHFQVTAPLSLERVRIALARAESLWAPMHEFFGDAPLTPPGKRLKIIVGRDRDGYQMLHDIANPNDPRSAAYSRYMGLFYMPELKTAYTYYHSEQYLQQWIGHCAAQLFMGEIADHTKLKSPMCEALGAYFESFDADGTYAPQKKDFTTAAGFLRKARFDDTPRMELSRFDIAKKEAGFAVAGFVMHYFVTTYPEVVKEWVPAFLKKGAGHIELVTAAEKKAGNDLQAEYQEFIAKAKGKMLK
jgi:hypothetical protein